jgi:hypothetical protein
MGWFGREPTSQLTGQGVKDLVTSQFDLLEPQLLRQETTMASRLTSVSTRATVLVGASAVLGGAELVTGSGRPEWTIISMALYALAALTGLAATRSRKGEEPDLPLIVAEYAEYKTISMRRELLLARLKSHDTAVAHLNNRHTFLVIGYVLLGIAWVSSGVGTAIGLMTDSPEPPTEIRIVE